MGWVKDVIEALQPQNDVIRLIPFFLWLFITATDMESKNSFSNVGFLLFTAFVTGMILGYVHLSKLTDTDSGINKKLVKEYRNGVFISFWGSTFSLCFVVGLVRLALLFLVNNNFPEISGFWSTRMVGYILFWFSFLMFSTLLAVGIHTAILRIVAWWRKRKKR